MPSNLIMSDALSDVILKVHYGGYSWRFPAHSLLLCARSSEFRCMLEERSTDASSPAVVTIISTHPDTIKAILRYMYADEYPTEVTPDLLIAAEKYGLTSFRERLEEQLFQNLSVEQACHFLEAFEVHGRATPDCDVRSICRSMIENHAHRVFASDLVFIFGRRTLLKLLKLHELNVPDEAVLFWGVWRWGRRYCSQNDRSLGHESVAAYVDDMLGLIRCSSLIKCEGIPMVAQKRFSHCLPRRCRYEPPDDILEQSSVLQACGSWEDLIDPFKGENGTLCLQMSFSKDVILVGLTLEICAASLKVAHIQLFRESDGEELLRQEINCFHCSNRKLSRTGEAEHWLRANVSLSEPLILPKVEIYSLYLRKCETPSSLPCAMVEDRKKRIGDVLATFHGPAVTAVRQIYLVPDFKNSWAPDSSHFE